MTYNNLQDITTTVEAVWTNTPIDYSSITLEAGIPHKDQLQVERIFALPTSPTNVKDGISGYDLHRVFLLEATEYTVNETNKTITGFNITAGARNYFTVKQTATVPSNTSIAIPVVSTSETIIIRRKTYSAAGYVNWTSGSRLTSAQLNLQTKQLLNIVQELTNKLDSEYIRFTDVTGNTAPALSVNNSLNLNSNLIINQLNPAATYGTDATTGVNKGYIESHFLNRSQNQAQTINGVKTFQNNVIMQGDLVVNNYLMATNLSVQSSNNWIQIIPNAGSGTFNPLTQPGDRLVAFGTTGADETSSVGLTIAPWSSSSVGLRMSGTGAIGIGLTSPQHPLDIRGITRISNSTTSGYGFVQYGSSATPTNNFHFGSEGDGNFNLYNGNVGAGSKVFGITSTGTVNLNGQLAFPATQNASSDVNTLDDYEEGTWTPTLTAVTTAPTGVTYHATNNSAWYVKIGRTVWIGGWLHLTDKGTGGVGSIYIDNIPFKASYAGYHQGITIGIAQNLTSLTAGSVVSGYINSPGNIMLISSGGVTGTIGNIVYSCVTNSTNIVFSGIYRVNN